MSDRRRILAAIVTEDYGRTRKDAARMIGVSPSLISQWLGRDPKKNLAGERFGRLVAVRETGERRDRKVVWECRCDCGKTCRIASRNLRKGLTKSCGCLQRDICYERNGPNHPLYKGGRKVDPAGYVHVVAPGHPRAAKTGAPYVREHILVMERKLGRALRDGENVHHINGQRDDNRPENLELWDVSQPSGQRVEDKLAWCREYLRQHEPAPLEGVLF